MDFKKIRFFEIDLPPEAKLGLDILQGKISNPVLYGLYLQEKMPVEGKPIPIFHTKIEEKELGIYKGENSVYGGIKIDF